MQNEENQNQTGGNSVSSVRTYKADVSEYIKKENVSLSDIAVAEESKREENLKIQRELKEKRDNIKKLLIKILVTVVAIILLIFVAIFIKNKVAPPLPDNYQNVVLDTPIETIAKMTDNEKENGVFLFKKLENTPGPIIGFLVSSDGKLVSLNDIFVSEGIYPPGELVRAFGSNYGFGKAVGGQFIITDLSYYPNATAGMIKWEKEMRDDLFTLFNLKIDNSTSGEGGSARFTDKILANQNTRVFTESSGTESLSYGFYNRKYLIITSTPETLQFILDNLSPR